jgi:hypothetical protein
MVTRRTPVLGLEHPGNSRTDRANDQVEPHDTEHVAGDGRVTRNELDLDAIDDPVIRDLVVVFADLVDAQPYRDLEDRFMSAMAQFITDAITGPSVTGTCAVCGRGPLWGRSDTRYCSNACRQRAYRRRKSVAS